MFILRELLLSLQAPFSNTDLGRARAHWFVLTLLAVIVPFTSSMTSNPLRSLRTLFGLDLDRRRFYTFMASTTLPWDRLLSVLWGAIPDPLADGRILVALDDSINNKRGRKIFGCGFFHDHTAKLHQPSYPWSQNIAAIGLLKIVKGRWSCLPLAFRFYFMKKDIDANAPTTQKSGHTVEFQSRMVQAVEMLKAVAAQFADTPVLVVADSWFGNNGLWRPLSASGCFPGYGRISRFMICHHRGYPEYAGAPVSTVRSWDRSLGRLLHLGRRRVLTRSSSMEKT